MIISQLSALLALWFENNLILVFLAILPIVVYSFAVYLRIPPGLISIAKCQRYFINGLLAPMAVLLWQFIFPNWLFPISETNMYTAYICYAFIQVGLTEEFFKYLTFKYTSTQLTKDPKAEAPIATMFYAMMTTAGFALLENIYYLINHGPQVLLPRAYTAICAHMIFGIIMGYFLAKSNKYSLIAKSSTDFLEKRKNLIKKWTNVVIGISMAAFYHGWYDFNYMIPQNFHADVFSIFIILFGFFVANQFIVLCLKDSPLQKQLKS